MYDEYFRLSNICLVYCFNSNIVLQWFKIVYTYLTNTLIVLSGFKGFPTSSSEVVWALIMDLQAGGSEARMMSRDSDPVILALRSLVVQIDLGPYPGAL